MFDNVLASIRIGAAEVDTLLDRETVQPGEVLATQVVVDGGEVDQDIEAIDLELKTKREHGDTRQTYEIASKRVTGAFTIEEGDQQVFEADLPIHHETPVTTLDAKYNRAQVWIDTDLEIDRAIDADDTDYLNVAPTDPMAAMLDAVSQAGHTLYEVAVDNDRLSIGNARAHLPLDQEFVFRPQGNREYNELEVHFLPRETVTHVLLEFDYRLKSEQFESLQIDHDSYSVKELQQAFEAYT